jgi:hypothetical protein
MILTDCGGKPQKRKPKTPGIAGVSARKAFVCLQSKTRLCGGETLRKSCAEKHAEKRAGKCAKTRYGAQDARTAGYPRKYPHIFKE